MEHKIIKPSAPVSSKASFSAQASAPHTPVKSTLKKSISIALVTLTLLGGAGYLYNKQVQPQGDESGMTVKQYKAEFVKNILALSDDGYQPVDKHIQGDHAHHNHDHDHVSIVDSQAAPTDAAPVVVDRHISALPATEEVQEPTSGPESEDDERLRALESEALSLNISEGIENHHQSERNQLILKKAEEAASFRAAREAAFQKREAKRIKAANDAFAYNAKKQQSMTIKLPYLAPQNPQLETFKGALTKCHIKGHDIHWINDQGWILEHLKVDAVLTPNVLIARQIIKARGVGIVVVVYEKGFEAYDAHGNLLETGNKE
jgi:hypothetical protein